MNHIYSNLSKSMLTLAFLLASAAGFAVVIPAGTTSNYTSDMNGTLLEVYGTLNFNPSNMNGSGNKVIAYSGGTVNILSNKTSLQNIILDIKSGGVLNIIAGSFTAGSSMGILNAGALHAGNTALTIGSGAALENAGSITLKSLTLESGSMPGIQSKNNGTIIITEFLKSNATYENALSGTIKVTGPCNTNNCGFTTSNGIFNNNGGMEINGTVSIDADMKLNGNLKVIGDLTIKRTLSGTNGKLSVVNGYSRMMGDGHYNGTNMLFYDQNTMGHNFDSKTSNNPSTDNYTVSSAALPSAAAALPLRFLSFEAIEYNQFSVYFKFSTTVEASLLELQLQGSTDGKNYITLESFTPHNANGVFSYTSSKLESSRYTSYRIAVINLDRVKEYSKTIFFRPSALPGKEVETSIFPNPVINGTFKVKVSSTEPAIINIYSNDGKILSNTILKGSQQYEVKMTPVTVKCSLVTIQVIQNGQIKSFTVINK